MSLAHFDSAKFGEVPLHWGPFIQLMMDGIGDVLTPDQQAAFRFTDIKDKYGRLSVSWQLPAELDSTTESQIELRISQAEDNIDQLDVQQASRQSRTFTTAHVNALAAIGEQVLVALRGRPYNLRRLRDVSGLLASRSDVVLQAHTQMIHDAMVDPNWLGPVHSDVGVPRLWPVTDEDIRWLQTATTIAVEKLAKQHDYPSRLVRRHFDEIVSIIAVHKGTNPRVFGSVARGEDTRDSDLDLLVDPGEGMTLFDIGGMGFYLNELLGIDVDVVTPDGLRGPMRTRVLAEAIPLCEFQIVSSDGHDA